MHYKKLILILFVLFSFVNICQAETLTLRPDGAGTYTDLSANPAVANYLNVDETVPDDDTTYVYIGGGFSDVDDTYNLGNSTYQLGPINSVTVYAEAKETGSGTIRLIVYTGGTRYFGDVEGLFGAYDDDDHTWSTNPNTGNPWTWGEINILEAGVNIYSNDAEVRITQVYVVVDYDLVAPTLENPVNESTVTSIPVFLNVSTTDEVTLSYYFYGGTDPDNMVFLGNNDSVGGNTYNWSISQYDVYYWTANAHDGYEYSSNMTTAQFTLIAPPNLTSPANASTTYTTYPPLTSTVSFTWQDIAAPQYRLMIAEDVNFNVMAVDTHVGTNNSNQDLLVNKEYWWKVYSYDGTTYSDSSDVFSFNLTGNSTLSGSAIEGVVYADIDGTYTALSGAEVIIWNATWTDTAITGSNGYFVFTGVASGQVYSVQAKKDLYLDSSVALVSATSDPITQDFYLLPDRTSEEWRHYVKFTVWGLAGYYEGVTVTVYENDDVTALYIKETGTDGSVTFIMNRDQEYRVTFVDSVQGIDKEMTLYPKETSYLVYIAFTNPWDEYSTPINEAIDIDVTTAIINSTAAYVNISYTDTLQQTTAATVYLNQTNNSDPYNQTVIGSQDGFSNNWTHSFIVTNYTGESYYVHVIATHDTYGTVDKTYAVSFNDNVIFDGIPSKFFLYLSIFIMLFTGAMFGASSVGQGSMIVCTEGWIFLAFGWFNSIDSGHIMVGLGFATVFSLVYLINQKTKKEGVE